MYIQGKVSRVNKTLLECFEFPTLSFCSHVNDKINCQISQKKTPKAKEIDRGNPVGDKSVESHLVDDF